MLEVGAVGFAALDIEQSLAALHIDRFTGQSICNLQYSYEKHSTTIPTSIPPPVQVIPESRIAVNLEHVQANEQVLYQYNNNHFHYGTQ